MFYNEIFVVFIDIFNCPFILFIIEFKMNGTILLCVFLAKERYQFNILRSWRLFNEVYPLNQNQCVGCHIYVHLNKYCCICKVLL